MSKPSFFIDSFGRKYLPIVLVMILSLITVISSTAFSQESKVTDKQEASRRIVQSYIQVGQEEYQKGYFGQAEKTFIMAREYQEFLTAAERERLSELIKRAQTAKAGRQLAEEAIKTANELIKQDKLADARVKLEQIKDNEFLNKNERAQIADVLKQINTQLIDDKENSEKNESLKLQTSEKLAEITDEAKKQDVKADENDTIAALFYHSIGYYRAGQLEKAREGFAKVAADGSTPETMKEATKGYLTQIDKSLAERAKLRPVREEAQLETMAVMESVDDLVEPELTEPDISTPRTSLPALSEQELITPVPSSNMTAQMVSSPVTGEGTYIDQINKTRNIIRDYTRTVVNDSVAKAQSYVEEGNCVKAKEAIANAEFIVKENRIQLGEELYKEHTDRLKTASDYIAVKEKEQTLQKEQEKRQAAMKSQEQFREQMETDRQKRVAELMENAVTYQKQKQYEAAISQLQSLLALDPQNEQALILKDTLEDMLYFQKQLEIQKEGSKQRADILLKTDESKIPYADEITYPKEWKEITEKETRKPDEPIGLDPIDANVYDRLEKIIDISNITESTSFGEFINILKTKTTPPLQIQPNWKDLSENASVDYSTPAGMDPQTSIKIRKALELLLDGLSSTDFAVLSYVVDEGVIEIATVDTLTAPEVPTGRLVSRVYDISDLVGEPAQFGGIQGMYMSQSLGQQMGGGGSYGGSGSYGGTSGGMGGGMMGGGMGGGMMGGGMGGGMMGGGMMGGGMMGGGMGGGSYGGMSGGGYGGMSGGGYGGMSGGGSYGGMSGGGYGGMSGGGYGGMGGGMGMSGMMGGMLAEDLRTLIQDSTGWENWADLSESGEGGSVTAYPTQQPKKLAVLATHQVHEEIVKLLTSLRKALGYQVSIEARYLVVTENFLEDIGLDVDFSYNLGGKWGQVTFQQDSAVAAQGEATQVPLSLGGIGNASTITGGYGSILDDLQVSFLLKATQAHRDAKALTAPIVSVLSGESASFNITRYIPIALPPVQNTGTTTTSVTGGGATTNTGSGITPQYTQVQSGSMLSITPVITHDKKNVLLNIITIQNDFLGIRTTVVEAPVVAGTTGGEVLTYNVQLPETETSTVMTRVSVPDRGTLLLGGQKISAEVETEAGVPILSKIPILGRLFSNRSTVKDQKILLILVKPTIILQEEREAEALAALENQ